jgi:hypothetical protein
MNRRALLELMANQGGLVARRQALLAGFTDAEVRRLLRRREWTRVYPGVFVDHTGPLTWVQRAWAAVLYAWPAALCAESALRAANGPGRRDHDDSAPIKLAVERDRKCRVPPGVVLHRLSDLDDKVLWNLGPPRMKIEEAVLDVASSAPDDLTAIAVLGDAVQSRRTTARRILAVLHARARIARRAFLQAVLDDLAEGACSALEQAYLGRVERAHGLPRGLRQVRASSRGPVYRDVEYAGLGFVVELDGRLDHSSVHDRDRDLERDLDAALEGRLTLRLGWGQAVGRPCRTASRIAAVMQARGWRGWLTPCPACERGNSWSPGDLEAPRSA